jgi:hypothetical protein
MKTNMTIVRRENGCVNLSATAKANTIPESAFRQRLRRGMSLEEALAKPFKNTGITWANGKQHPEYKAWISAKQRTTNPEHPKWVDYGGRGIKMCSRWLNSFVAFLEDMGPRPPGDYSLERRDNEKGYDPGNCCWATRQQQQCNKRSNTKVETPWGCVALAEACRKMDVNPAIISQKMRQEGITAEEALGLA